MQSSSPPSPVPKPSAPNTKRLSISPPRTDSRPADEEYQELQRTYGSDTPAGNTPRKPPLHRTNTVVSPFFTGASSPFDDLGSSADRVFPVRSVVSVEPKTASANQIDGKDYADELDQGSTGVGSRSSSTKRHPSTSSLHSIASSPTTSQPQLSFNNRPEENEARTPSTVASEPPRRPEMFRRGSTETRERMGGSRQMQTFVGIASTRSQSISSTQGCPASISESTRSVVDDPGSLITARFKHAVIEGGHAVITGRDGDTLQRCEDEPIHIPGAIQSFGLLIALHEEEEGKLKVRVVSENSERIIGFTPKQLFALESFTDILSDDQSDNLLDHIDFIRDDDADPATNGPDVFTMAFRAPKRRIQKLWCAMHINPNSPDTIICEFELEDDKVNPLVPANEATPEPPEDTLNTEPTPEEYAESTINMSKPLRVLRSARKRKGEAAAMEVFNIMSQVQEQLASATSLESFLKILVGVVKELTGFHRVMVYQFDQSWNGRVVTELVDPRATKDLYKGLNFPASDIPAQARDLYKINKVRLLYDRDQETARLARKLINTAPSARNPSGYIIASSDDLLKLFDADYGLLSIRGETKILGRLEQTQEALALLEYLRLRKLTSVTHSTDISLDFPDLRYPPGFSAIAGLLLVPLSGEGQDFIVFFRKGQLREVKWAGNPYEKFVKEGTEGYLEPRKSFKTWSETVVGKCRDWTEEQAETAAVLCLVYGKFIEVWRQKEAALENSQLTRLLLANSAHEVRTPLNAIINYLEIALEGAIDQETRDNLAKSHSASKSLIYVINDLLDLTKTEEGHNLVQDEIFDLPATFREATDQFVGDAKRKRIDYEVNVHEGVPHLVVGDQRRIRQMISNVTANAIQHTSSGAVKGDMWQAARSGGDSLLPLLHVDIDIVVQDTGTGMSQQKIDALFRELEQVQAETDESLQEKLAPQTKAIEAQNDGKRTLGLGLALVARIIRNMNGQLRLKSEEGKGSRFIIQLGFYLPSDSGDHAISGASEAAGKLPHADGPETPPVESGEKMLIDKSAQKSRPASRVGVQRLPSSGSVNSLKSVQSVASLKSFRSGSTAKSDVDRLIGAIQEPIGPAKQHAEADSFFGRSTSRSSRNYSPSSSRPTSVIQASQTLDTTHSLPTVSGQSNVKDSKTPIRAVRVPAEDSSGSPGVKSHSRTPSRVLFGVSNSPTRRVEPITADCLRVLVAEDDPINSRIMRKRLEKLGHRVHLTVNGEECSSAFGEGPTDFDVVLMDMQMPIVDGLTSAKLIRSFEKTHPGRLSPCASLNGRIPIIAVSASLVEKDRQMYIDGGFDGWILKPVDFQRLSVLLHAIVEEETRSRCLYRPGEWERGGWFRKRATDPFSASTAPSSTNPVSQSSSQVDGSQDDSTDQERERLNSLENDAVHSESAPENPGQSGNWTKSTIEE
ncbi:MAG: hypothetical protein Q9195_005701 [Heterodermia aff. obscurata]